MSGLRDELAALADEWERRENATDERWAVDGYAACDELRNLLDRFPPEAEGEALAKAWDEGWFARSGENGLTPDQLCIPNPYRPALAASPEEQDRG